MKTLSKRAEYPTKNAILKLLSDRELAQLHEHTRPEALPNGEAFIDLGHLYRGVMHAEPTMHSPVDELLAKSQLREETWALVCERLARLPPPRS